MKKYHKSFNNKIRENKSFKKTKTYFDKLYIRIFLSSLLLLILLSGKNLLKIDLFNNINNNINILPIVKLFTKIYDFESDIPVNVINNYDNIEFIDGINYVTNESYNGVTVVNSGIVIKVEKKNDYYFVTIKDDSGTEYTYGYLGSIDVSLYSYVSVNKTIGTANLINNNYSFTIEIKNGNSSNLLTLDNE